MTTIEIEPRCRAKSPLMGIWARGRQRGLTLIEILIVLMIIGLIMWSASMSMGAASQAEVVRTTNQLASTVRFAYDRARFTGYYYRIHIDFEQRSFQLQKAEDAMYLPSTDRDGELFAKDDDKLRDQAERDARAADSYFSTVAAAVYSATGEDNPYDPYTVQKKEVPRQRPPLFEAFEDDATLGDLGKPIVFPDGVEILSVQTDADPEPITEGEADLYFFPRGQTQLAAIQLKGKPKLGARITGEDDIEYTILVQPLTGKVTVEAGIVDLELPAVIDDTDDDLGDKAERRSF
ncbi:General secretion pathway protein H [Enhygromyxa salina]|uniref:General secretion pathway protein H n=1 Tax=Enhygromyxa salina TaxID=215803 RepID=A0A0C2DAJ9_9BACT|nr:prepilin-type N-terminal cleavage/methylation domain-containing protein [Enhygromyxa salina]KIG18540.1 General secretion pathway protein H [Enhygromyxa salina]